MWQNSNNQKKKGKKAHFKTRLPPAARPSNKHQSSPEAPETGADMSGLW